MDARQRDALDSSETRRLRWEDATDWWITGLAVLFLIAYAWPTLDQDLDRDWALVLAVVSDVTWALMALDYVIRVWLSVDRMRFIRGHLLDLAAVLLPMFRPLRALRLLTALSVLNRSAGTTLRGRVAVYVFGGVTIVLFVAAVAVLEAEADNPEANISTFGEALWWALTTITTVGYGDHYPTTVDGRIVAVSLMIAGIALVGTVTASIATWLIDQVRQLEEDQEAATRRDVLRLSMQVQELQQQIRALADGRPGRPAPAAAQPAGTDPGRHPEPAAARSVRMGRYRVNLVRIDPRE